MKWADGDKLDQLKQEESKLKADIKNRMDTIKQEMTTHEQ